MKNKFMILVGLLLTIMVSGVTAIGITDTWPTDQQIFEGDNTDNINVGIGFDFEMVANQKFIEGEIFKDNVTFNLGDRFFHIGSEKESGTIYLGPNLTLLGKAIIGMNQEIFTEIKITIPSHNSVPERIFNFVGGHFNGFCAITNLTIQEDGIINDVIQVNESVFAFSRCDIDEIFNNNVTLPDKEKYIDFQSPYIMVDDVIYDWTQTDWTVESMNLNLSYVIGPENITHNVSIFMPSLNGTVFSANWSFSIINNSVIVPLPVPPVDPPSNDDEDSGSSGGSGSGSGGTEYVGNDALNNNNGSILMYQFCIGEGREFKFYAKDDGKVIIKNFKIESNGLVSLGYNNDAGNGGFSLELGQNTTADLLNPNLVDDSRVVYYKNSGTTLDPCFQIYQILEEEVKEIVEPVQNIPTVEPEKNNTPIIEPVKDDGCGDDGCDPIKKSKLWYIIPLLVMIVLLAMILWYANKSHKKEMKETETTNEKIL